MTWNGYEPDAKVLPSFSLILLLIVLISKMYFFQKKNEDHGYLTAYKKDTSEIYHSA